MPTFLAPSSSRGQSSMCPLADHIPLERVSLQGHCLSLGGNTGLSNHHRTIVSQLVPLHKSEPLNVRWTSETEPHAPRVDPGEPFRLRFANGSFLRQARSQRSSLAAVG